MLYTSVVSVVQKLIIALVAFDMWIDTILIFVVLLFLLLVLVSLVILFFKQKTILAKIQIFNSINTICILLILVYFYYVGTPEYLDIAILYAIVSYVFIITLRTYFINISKNE